MANVTGDRMGPNSVKQLWKEISGVFVRQVSGKGLSTNDYTNDEKTKLQGIAAGAQVNVLEGVQVNGTDLSIDAQTKKVNVVIPEADVNVIEGVQVNGNDLTPDANKKVNVQIPILTVQRNGSALTPDANKAVNVEVPVLGVQRNGDDLTPDGTTKKVNIEVPVLGVQVNGSDLTPDSTTKKVNVVIPEADVNVIEGVQVNGSDLTPDASKKVNVVIPVLGVQVNGSDLTPDSTTKKVNIVMPTVDAALDATSENAIQNKAVKAALDLKAPLASPSFTGTPEAPTAAAGTNTTQIATTAFVKTAVDNAIAGVTQFDTQVVTELPASGVKGVIYLIAHSHGSDDVYDEYIWNVTTSTFEKIGNTDIDLSGYVRTEDYVELTNADITALVAEAEAELAA